MSNSTPATLCKDGYKAFHPSAYHPLAKEVYTNYINRSGKYSNLPVESQLGGVVTAGIQRFVREFLIEHFNETFFTLPIDVAVHQELRVLESYLGKPMKASDVMRLRALHTLGYLPLVVKAIPEGTIVPYGVATCTIRNTLPGFEWLPNMIETVLSCEISGIATSATTSAAYYRNFLRFAKKTGASEELIPFQGHDFSMRGLIFGRQSAFLSGLGHLMGGFVGTDTIGAGIEAERYYGANIEKELVIASVDATEHSVTCSWSEEGEEAFLEYLMDEASQSGNLSVVADTWDFWNFVTNILTKDNIRERIEKREGKLVVRPDSGDPVEILCGKTFKTVLNSSELESMNPKTGNIFRLLESNKYVKVSYADDNHDYQMVLTEVPAHEVKGLIEVLWDQFGGTWNSSGYRQLNPKIGAIYGDSITLARQEEILEKLATKRFASDNIVLGIGSYTYQYVTRDTHGSAVKATSMVKGDRRVAIFKDPITDPGKKSARGLLYVGRREDGTIYMEMDVSEEREQEGLLQEVFLDGVEYNFTTLEDIRGRVKSQLENLI